MIATTAPIKPTLRQEGSPLLTALLIASLIHGLLLLGIRFTAPTPIPSHTLAIAIQHMAPTSGTATQTSEAASQLKPAPTPTLPHEPARAHSNKPQPSTVTPKTAPKPTAPKLLNRAADTPIQQPEAPRPLLSAEALQQQISQLGERIRSSQPSTPQKVKFANTVSNHRYLAAQYVQDWENKVERTGNLNYPEAARHKREPQTLTMDVGINADGSIYSIRITRSSGNPELDEAAKRIVRMSAPFAELPAELLQEVNVLVITRVWKFSDETGMTSH